MPNPPPLRTKLVRPASITIRYSTPAAYFKAASFYYRTLHLPTAPPPRGPEYSFPVGKALDDDHKDIQMRLLLVPNDKPELKDKTIIYWQVIGKTYDDIAAAQRELTSTQSETGYTSVLQSLPNQLPPAGSTEESIIADANGNTAGLVINPPYPRITDPDPDPGNSGGSSNFFGDSGAGLLIGLLAGALLGWLLARWRKR